MIKLNKISNHELIPLVEIAYRNDNDLLEFYWGDSYSLIEAVNETMNAIKIISHEVEQKGEEMYYYSVVKDEEEIGYMCCFDHNLYSFGININHRKKDTLIEFWEMIKEIIGDSFICMLFPQNTRAIDFLKKQGMVEVEGIEPNCVTLLNI